MVLFLIACLSFVTELFQDLSQLQETWLAEGKLLYMCECVFCVKSLALLKLSIVGWMINKRFCVKDREIEERERKGGGGESNMPQVTMPNMQSN